MNTTVYNNTVSYKQLNRLTIARITSAKKRLDKEAYTQEQLFNIQRLANKIHKDKEFIIIF